MYSYVNDRKTYVIIIPPTAVAIPLALAAISTAITSSTVAQDSRCGRGCGAACTRICRSWCCSGSTCVSRTVVHLPTYHARLDSTAWIWGSAPTCWVKIWKIRSISYVGEEFGWRIICFTEWPAALPISLCIPSVCFITKVVNVMLDEARLAC